MRTDLKNNVSGGFVNLIPFMLFVLFLFHSNSALSIENNKHNTGEPIIEVVPLNTQIKGHLANFSLKVPAGIIVENARYKIKNTTHIFDQSETYIPVILSKQGIDYNASVNVNNLPPGHYQLHLKIIDKINKEYKGQQRKKHILKDYTAFIIDDSQVPVPDPKKDAATLEGIDSDKDGLPDRLQIWINASSYSEDLKQSLKQTGRLMQLVLLNHQDPVTSLLALNAMVETASCAITLNGSDIDKAYAIRDQATSIMLNTEARIIAYRLANIHASGTSSSVPKDMSKEAVCNF